VLFVQTRPSSQASPLSRGLRSTYSLVRREVRRITKVKDKEKWTYNQARKLRQTNLLRLGYIFDWKIRKLLITKSSGSQTFPVRGADFGNLWPKVTFWIRPETTLIHNQIVRNNRSLLKECGSREEMQFSFRKLRITSTKNSFIVIDVQCYFIFLLYNSLLLVYEIPFQLPYILAYKPRFFGQRFN